MREKWADIIGYEGLYQVSSLGRVRSLDRRVLCRRGDYKRYKSTRAGSVLSPGVASNDYLTVSLSSGGEQKTRTVHSLVLESFVGNRPSKRHECRHLDGDRTNNKLNNLSWGTPEENGEDRKRHMAERAAGTLTKTKLSREEVLEIVGILKNKSYGRPTYKEIGLEFGVGASSIHNIDHGKSWSWLTGVSGAN